MSFFHALLTKIILSSIALLESMVERPKLICTPPPPALYYSVPIFPASPTVMVAPATVTLDSSPPLLQDLLWSFFVNLLVLLLAATVIAVRLRVATLSKSLDAKDVVISAVRLRADMLSMSSADKDAEIAALKARVAALSSAVTEKDSRIAALSMTTTNQGFGYTFGDYRPPTANPEFSFTFG